MLLAAAAAAVAVGVVPTLLACVSSRHGLDHLRVGLPPMLRVVHTDLLITHKSEAKQKYQTSLTVTDTNYLPPMLRVVHTDLLRTHMGEAKHKYQTSLAVTDTNKSFFRIGH